MGFNHLIDTAFDPYVFVRNSYLEHREFIVHGVRGTSAAVIAG